MGTGLGSLVGMDLAQKLPGGRKIRDLNLQKDSDPLYLVQTSATMTILKEVPVREYVVLAVHKSDTVAMLKAKIKEKEGTSIRQQVLFFEGKKMDDDNREIQKYGIGHNVMVKLEVLECDDIQPDVDSQASTVELPNEKRLRTE